MTKAETKEPLGIERVDEFVGLDDKTVSYRRLIGVIAIGVGLFTLVAMRKRKKGTNK
jgi:hypothetical protein